MNAWIQVAVPLTAFALQTACALHVGVRLPSAPGARAFALALGCQAWWAAGYVFELLARGVAAKVFWDHVQLPPAFLLPAFMLIFAFDYCGKRPHLWKLWLALAMTPPAIATAWVFTDPLHGDARATAHVVASPPFDKLLYEFSTLETVAYAEMVLIMGFVVVRLFVYAVLHAGIYRRQAFVIALGSVPALVANLPGVGISVQVLGQRDSSPVWFALSGLLITFGLRRYGLFDLAPVARDAVFEQLADAVFVIDTQGRLVDANPAARQLIEPAPVLGSDARAALAAWPALVRALDASASDRPELDLPRDGAVYELRIAELHARGARRGRALVLRDVTARARANAELERRVKERTSDLLAQVDATRAAHAARARLEAQLHTAQRLESIGRLAGGVAHDFNNLLTVILGNVQLARSRFGGTGELDDYLGGIEQAGTSASDLTRQLLAFARQNVVEPQVLVLNQVVENTRTLIERLLGEDIKLRLKLAPDLSATSIDPSYAEQILINLAVNARDAMPRGGGLYIETANVVIDPPRHDPATGRDHAGNYVCLLVRDEGTGMKPDVLSRVFEPFFTTKPLGAGTGLGLSMVYGAVQRANGFVDVESEEGRGTTFYVFLPKNAGSPTEAARRAALEQPGAGELVALVEDQQLVLLTVKTQLEGLGYRVREFASAEEARKGLHGRLHEVDVLLSDVVLAGQSGRELAEELRAERPDLPVIFMSGYTDDVVLRYGIERGSVFFLEKPFTLDELGRTVRNALEQREPRAKRPFSVVR